MTPSPCEFCGADDCPGKCPEYYDMLEAEAEAADNYDGPDDGDEWSGGFAENH